MDRTDPLVLGEHRSSADNIVHVMAEDTETRPILYRCGDQDVPTGYRATEGDWEADTESRATAPFVCPACEEIHYWSRGDPDTSLGED